jgi:hypothetical protein
MNNIMNIYTNKDRIIWLRTSRDGLCLIQSIANGSRLVRARAPRNKEKKKKRKEDIWLPRKSSINNYSFSYRKRILPFSR